MTQLKRFQEALAKSKFDAALISSSVNQRYLSDFSYSDGYILVCPHSAWLLADFRYIEAARERVNNDFEIIMPTGRMSGTLSELISQNGFVNIAIEETSVSCSTLAALTDALPKECGLLHGASKMLNEQRAIKLPYEIERMKKAQEITDSAFAHILSFISPEVTERELALEIEFFMRRNGAEAAAFNTIAVSGPASSLPHGVPSDVKLRQGLLTMDFGARYAGYCSDMTRTVVIGSIDSEMKKVYDTVLSAQEKALAGIHAGMLCRDADDLARSVIRDAGYGEAFGHSLGHGVGMNVHENPSLSQRAPENSFLTAGNVVTVEPGIYLEGRFGCRIEDMIAINEDGSIFNFTKSPKELIII